MRNLMKKFDKWMSAITFAEANEHDTALELAGFPHGKERKEFSLDRLMAAVTFAEAGEPDMAREYIDMKERPRKAKDLAIPGIRIWCGSVALEPVPIPGVKIWFGTITA